MMNTIGQQEMNGFSSLGEFRAGILEPWPWLCWWPWQDTDVPDQAVAFDFCVAVDATLPVTFDCLFTTNSTHPCTFVFEFWTVVFKQRFPAHAALLTTKKKTYSFVCLFLSLLDTLVKSITTRIYKKTKYHNWNKHTYT